jgi:PAS domain S-box-containing protein
MGAERKKTILLVEDEAITAMAEKSALERYGYTVITVLSGEKAVATVETTPGIDLILMDINLGSGIDGTEAAAAILSKRDIPVVFLSSHMEQEVVEKTEKITSYGYVVKDSSITVLDASIKMAFKLFEAKIREKEKESQMEAALETLRKSEERYSLINNSSCDSIYSYDTQGRFSSANNNLCNLLKLDARQIIGHTHQELGFPDDLCREWENLHRQVYETNHTIIAETTAPVLDGDIHDFEVILNPMHDSEGNIIGIGGTTRDISERKQVAQALRESEERMRAIIEGTPHLFFYIQDAQANTTYVSPTIENITGYKAETWLQRKDWFITDAAVNQAAREITQAHLRGEFKKEAVLVEIRHANGHPILLEAYEYPITKNGEVVGLQGVAHDITRRKLTETSLRESEERLHDIIYSMADWVWEVDGNGVYTYSSEKVKDFLGTSPEDIIGKTPFDFMPADEAKRVAAIFSEISANKLPIKNLENWNIGINGEKICLLTSGVPILDEKGNLKGYRGVDKDITTSKQIQSQREATLLALLESEEKYRILIENSHDIIFSLSTEGIFTFVSPSWTTLLGHPVNQVVGKPFQEFVHPEDIAGCMTLLQKAIETGQRQNGLDAYRVRHVDGSWRWHITNAVPLRDATGTVVGGEGIARDITDYKHAEETLKNTIRFQHVLMDAVPSPIFYKDASLVYLGGNRAFERYIGLSREQFIGKSVYDISPADLAGIYNKADRALLNSQGAQTYESSVVYADGIRHDVVFHKAPFTDAEGNVAGLIGVILDISERKRAEQALRESEERYRSILNASPDIIGITDMEGRVIMVSPATLTMLGYKREEEVSGHLFTEFIHPDDRSRAFANVALMFQGNMTGLGEYKGLRADRTAIDLEVNSGFVRGEDGRPTQMVFIIRDISDRKRAEAALGDAETRYRLLFEQSPDGIVIIDPATAGILEFNETAHRQLGYSRKEFARLSIPDIEAAETPEETQSRIARVMHEGLNIFETRQRTRQGDIRNILVTAQFTKILNRPIYHCIWRDITELKQSEEEIKRQLAEKEILLREVHHRIKNNIASIGGLLSLHMRTVTHPQAIAALRDAIGRVDSLHILYDKLLLTEDYKELSVKNYLDDLVEKIFAIFPDNAKIKIEKRIDDFQLDPKRLFPLGSIINELLTNIMKYAFAGRKTGLVKISLSKAAGHVTLTVQDNGIGLPEGFDVNESKGFGLVLVKMLSQQLGGEFAMEKRKGTRCTIEFDMERQ